MREVIIERLKQHQASRHHGIRPELQLGQALSEQIARVFLGADPRLTMQRARHRLSDLPPLHRIGNLPAAMPALPDEAESAESHDWTSSGNSARFRNSTCHVPRRSFVNPKSWSMTV